MIAKVLGGVLREEHHGVFEAAREKTCSQERRRAVLFLVWTRKHS